MEPDRRSKRLQLVCQKRVVLASVFRLRRRGGSRRKPGGARRAPTRPVSEANRSHPDAVRKPENGCSSGSVGARPQGENSRDRRARRRDVAHTPNVRLRRDGPPKPKGAAAVPRRHGRPRARVLGGLMRSADGHETAEVRGQSEEEVSERSDNRVTRTGELRDRVHPVLERNSECAK
jgi:hypothetical protein